MHVGTDAGRELVDLVFSHVRVTWKLRLIVAFAIKDLERRFGGRITAWRIEDRGGRR